MTIKLNLIRTVTLGFAAMIVFASMGCKKSKDEVPIEKKEITVIAKRVEMLLLPGIIKPDEMWITFNYDGSDKKIRVRRTDAPIEVNGTIDFSNTNIVTANSTTLPVNSNESIALKNLNLPTTIVVALDNDPIFTKITVQFDTNTQLYFVDQPNRDTYLIDRNLLMTNVKMVADWYDGQTLFLLFSVE